jgi:hypothetical protein
MSGFDHPSARKLGMPSFSYRVKPLNEHQHSRAAEIHRSQCKLCGKLQQVFGTAQQYAGALVMLRRKAAQER